MSLESAKLPSLKDKHREITNAEIAEKTEEMLHDTEPEKVVKKKKSK